MSAPRRLPRSAVVGLVTLVATVLVGVGAVGATRAAWTDRAQARTVASAGTWAPPSTCAVHDEDGTLDPTTPCTVVDGSVRFSAWSAGAGAMRGNAYATFSASGIDSGQYVAFDVTLPDPADARWSWAGAGVSNANGATVGSACAALPRVTGRLPGNRGETPGLYLVLDSPRSSDPACGT